MNNYTKYVKLKEKKIHIEKKKRKRRNNYNKKKINKFNIIY